MVQLHSIQLTARENNWRLFMLRKADSAFLSFQQKILRRDHYACQFCGFQAQHCQEVVNVDHNYLNNKASNLATACIFCAQCFFLDAIGQGGFGGGTLIYLPELSQTKLNGLCHALFQARMIGNAFSEEAKEVYRSLRLRSQAIEEELGEGMSNPALLGNMLIDSKTDIQNIYSEIMEKVRVLPTMSRFVDELKTWVMDGLIGFCHPVASINEHVV